MKNFCVSEAISLGRPVNCTLIMHVITCFEVPINLFGVYCILFKTPRKMESVKWPILIMQLISSMNDFLISFITIPYVYFPVLAGLPLGAINAPILEIFGLISLLGGTGAAIVAIFENRYYILFGKGNTLWGLIRKPYLAINFVMTPICLVPIFLTIPEQNQAFSSINKIMSCSPELPSISRSLIVFKLDGTRFFTVVFILTMILTTGVITFGITVIVKMIRQDKKKLIVSRHTLDLQRKLVIALILQTIFPIIVLLLPTFYIIISVISGYHNQSANNLVFCIFAVHGFLSTLIMILVHSPYRKVTLYPFYQLRAVREPPSTIAHVQF